MLADDGQAIGLMVGQLRDALGERRPAR
jgi:hypothetical protein